MTYKQWCRQRPRSAAEKKSYKIRILKRNVLGTLMALAPFLGFLCFTLTPMLVSLGLSFTKIESYRFDKAVWIGLANYKRIIHLDLLWRSVSTTLIYCVSVPINICMCLFLANLINKKIKGKKVWMAILFLPQVCSGVASTVMWQWIFEENYGVINTMLYRLGFSKVQFMTNANAFIPAVLIIYAWQRGTNIVVLSAAFASIDKTLQEAARIDGATELRVFWSVTFPQLTPTIFYILTMNLIAALQEQTVMKLLATGTNSVGPGYRAMTLSYYIYYMISGAAMKTYGVGMACALSWVTAIVIYIITRINFRLSKLWVSYD